MGTLTTLNKFKSPWPDGLYPRTQKTASVHNSSEFLERGKVPEDWKQANVPVFQRGEGGRKEEGKRGARQPLTSISEKLLEQIIKQPTCIFI